MFRKRILFLIIGLLGMQIMTSAHAQVLQGEQSSHFVSSKEIYQMRIYEIFERNKDAFHARFRDHAARIMKRYDFHIVAMWEAKSQGRPEFVYVIRWPDEATMKRQWSQFMSDQEWDRIKKESAQEHGKMVGHIEERVMLLTSYSNPIEYGR
ncbi:NIPSNAP family protein [Klebsiella pneumoniae]|uniref:NIPSNAP family protein n=2 Tax=Gammaproteobacteria TaxID=1236 RepID=UPI000AA6A688|nr:NIPSNAP family protein [Klebsiella pneumoniae]MCY0067433.1 NIPSNAP family protein [Klebsiella pneumoniae]HEM6677857.1 NIPSNAP family protein [Citrobacter amalonaticus]